MTSAAEFARIHQAVFDRVQPLTDEGGEFQGVRIDNPGLAILALEAHDLGQDVTSAVYARESLELVGQQPNQSVIVPASEIQIVVDGLRKIGTVIPLAERIANRHRAMYAHKLAPLAATFAQPLGQVLNELVPAK